MKGIDARREPNLAIAGTSVVLREVSVPVRVYDSNTIQAEIGTDESRLLLVFAEKSLIGDWMFSFWVTSPSKKGLGPVDRQILLNFEKEYNLLFSACVKVLAQMTSDPEIQSKLRVNSYDAWIERNFLKGWNGDISDATLRVDFIDERTKLETGNLFSHWIAQLPWAKPARSQC